jgi:tRNA A-37 threonylcarbamoyl transferase component Bud32/N-acetylneuraminic acid mutarotase
VEMPRAFGHADAYRVVSELGRGGFATVYKAYQASLDRDVAIKVLRPEIVQDEKGLERFQREARVAARLSAHPNIVTIYDYGEQAGRAYLVLEYIDGMTLERRLLEPISVIEIEEVTRAVASALDYAHSHQFVHRDVKPSNILLGSDGRIFLSDFGIAKLIDAVTSATGGVLGTVEYMAPEQITGGTVDARSDVYAFGTMVYHMFAGRPPFDGSFTTVLYKHVHEPPPPLVTVGSAVSPAVEPIVRKALAKIPSERYISAGEFAKELARALRPAILLERAHVAYAQNELDQAELLTSELLAETALDAGGHYVSGRVQHFRQAIQVARLLESGDWEGALGEIDRLRLRETDDAAVVELVRRADQLRELETARVQAEQRLAERQRLEQEARGRAEAEAQARAARQQLEEEARRRAEAEAQAHAEYEQLEREVRIRAEEEARAQADYERLQQQVQPRPESQATRRARPSDPEDTLDLQTEEGSVGARQRRGPAGPVHTGRASGVGSAFVEIPIPASQATPPAGQPRTRTAKPGRRILWLGLLILGLLGAGALIGTRLLGRDTVGLVAEPAVSTVPIVSESTAVIPLAPTATVPQAAVSTLPAPPSTTPQQTAASQPPVAPPTALAASTSAPPLGAVPPPGRSAVALAPPLSNPRYLHTATRLDDGKILVVGGRSGGDALDTAELYDPSTNIWISTAKMATARYRHTATLLPDGSIVVTGGQSGDGSFLDTAERYDPLTNSWASAGRMGAARATHTTTLLDDGRLLVAGGYNTRQFHNAAELYEPATNTWNPAAAMTDVHSGHTATLLPNGQVMVAGGFGTTSQATAEQYDASSNRWTSAGSMQEGRLDHTATLLANGTVLVAGGVNSHAGGTYLATAEIYDPAAKTWAAAAPMAGPRSGHTAGMLPSGQVLIAGGRDASSSLSSSERYDPTANAWGPAGTLAAARWLPASALLPDGRILLTGGRVGNGSLAFVEQYDPGLNDWAGQGQSITLSLTSQNGSGITGTATLTNMGGGKLRVEMHANGAGAGPHPAHIHQGSCTQLNPAPSFPLANVVDGNSVSDVDASLQQVTSAPHAIHMHKSPEEMPIYVACADTQVPG